MGFIEAPFGDLMLGLMQAPLVRWSAALIVSLWVWLVGDEDAALRKVYLIAPFAIAGLVELADQLVLGPATGQSAQGGWFPHFLLATEALRRFASLVGVGALALAAALGFKRGIGFAFGVGVLLCAYFVDGMAAREGHKFFSTPVFGLMAMLLPSILMVVLTFYGFGATLRRFWESRRAED